MFEKSNDSRLVSGILKKNFIYAYMEDLIDKRRKKTAALFRLQMLPDDGVLMHPSGLVGTELQQTFAQWHKSSPINYFLASTSKRF